MAAATRQIVTWDKSSGSPKEAVPVNATVAEAIFEDGAIPGAKLADGGVSAAKVAAASLTPSKLDAGGTIVAGSLAIPFVGAVSVPSGVTGDVATFTAPVKCRLVSALGSKTDGAGGVGEFIELRTAAAGGGSAIAVFGLNVSDGDFVSAGAWDDTKTEILAGGIVVVHRVTGGANNAADIALTFVPVD